MPNDIPIIADPLQPPVCIGCGYELTGLAPDCICPECGFKRDAGVLMLRGFNLYDLRYRRLEVTPKSAVMMCVLLSVYLVARVYWLHVIEGRLLVDAIILSVLGPLTVLACIYFIGWYQRRHAQHYPVSLLISGHGVAQRTRFSPQVQWVDWLGLRLARFDLHRGYWRVFLKKEDRLYLPAIEHHRGRPVAFEFQASDETAAQVRALILRCIENAEREPPPTGPAEPHEAWDTGRR